MEKYRFREKKIALLPLFAALILSSCGESSSMSSSWELTLSNVPEEVFAYEYSLEDDANKGEAIYPDVAYRKLKEIEAHNKENGLPFFETGYNANNTTTLVDGTLLGPYVIQDEHYIPGEFYYFEENSYFMKQTAESYYYLEDEFFHGFYDNNSAEDTFYCPSSVETMESRKDRFRIHSIYEEFLQLTGEIAKKELEHPSDPEDWRCYSAGEGSLYLNLYQTISTFSSETRYIYRIVYENYLPIFAVSQKVDGIFGNDDYCNEAHWFEFSYEDIEIEPDLVFRFRNRRDDYEDR